ncbi:MAG: hypothetical protein ACR2L9_03025 [Solirubrobacteraceae bacterium]
MRAQLLTENTLYPVPLVLDERRHAPATLRLWAIVSGVINGGVAIGHFLGWLVAVTLGNVAGGVVIVGLLNYGQVRAGKD